MQLAAFACWRLLGGGGGEQRVGGTSTVAVDDHDTGVHSIVDGARVDDRGQL